MILSKMSLSEEIFHFDLDVVLLTFVCDKIEKNWLQKFNGKYRINMVIKTRTLLVPIAFICFLCILQTNSKLTKQLWFTYFIFYFIFLGWEWDSGLFRWQWWNFCFGKMVDASNRSFGFIKSCHIHFVCHESNRWPGKHNTFDLPYFRE